MPRYGNLDKLEKELNGIALDYLADGSMQCNIAAGVVCNIRDTVIANAPTADVVEIETLKAWLYEIAMNNVGCNVDDFASACEEIASRLDGLRAFARERKNA